MAFPSLPIPRRRGSRGAFTLVEIMVSIGVLMCIILLVGQLVSSLTLTTSNASKLSDADNQARLIFAKMSGDFAAMYNRPDVNYYFLSQNGNDAFYFYSEATGHIAAQDPAGTSDASQSGASLVGYRVSDVVSGGSRIELERLGLGLHWVDVAGQTEADGHATSMLFLPTLLKDAFSRAIATPYNNSSNSNTSNPSQWDVIGDQVFRMEFCFLLKDGTFSTTPVIRSSALKGNFSAGAAPGTGDDSLAGYVPGSRWYDARAQVAYRCVGASPESAAWVSLGLQDVKAVVVSLALIYPKGRASTSIGALIRAVSTLPDFTGSKPVSAAWSAAALDAASFKGAGLSPLAASSVRVYERFFYLN